MNISNLSPEKLDTMEALLTEPLLARIATANLSTGQPHVVPLWYLWDGKSIWVSGFRSTRKFRNLLLNPRCAILVEPANPKESKLQGVLFEGIAEIITDDRATIEQISNRIYLRYLGDVGLQDPEPQSWIRDPENLVAQLTPENVYLW
jgi:nitroimidazol reductase NimA-like FMN-containing flavoprotein (pyridoxamine 5'-phosphate oxidase superfamily)